MGRDLLVEALLFHQFGGGVLYTGGTIPGCPGIDDTTCFCNFSAPLALAPSSTTNRVYGASNRVYKFENGLTRSVLNGNKPLDSTNHVNCLAVSAQDQNIVYAGTAPDPSWSCRAV